MHTTKFHLSIAFFLAIAVVGVRNLVALADDEPKNASGALAARIDQRVQAWQPTAQERRLDQIGWAKDIRDGLRLAKEHGRPLFLFTYSGSTEREHAMALQRC
jgi:hypothetical protein